MKTIILALVLSLSTSAFARQYIQCSTSGDTSDVAVVNLTTVNSGTLFISSGMQNPDDERLLVNIALEQTENGKHVYKVVDEQGEGFVSVPSSVIGKSANSFSVDLTFAEYSFSYGCFSRIYND